MAARRNEHATIVPKKGGPLYVRGRVQLLAGDGSVIVEETRMTLCRCGRSGHKPFCDNSHRGSGFDD
jgi:CDGSH-type Zn-finger protein